EIMSPLDTTIVITYFNGLPVSTVKDFTFKFNPYSRYYYLDYAVEDSLFLFSIIHNDEDGYNNLYHGSINARKNKMISLDLIAQTGGDGGHFQKDILHYTSKGKKLNVTSISTSDEDLDFGYKRTKNSTIVNFSFGFDRTIESEISNVTTIDTIK
ncbi:MAG TPA: hypothetical protein VF691_22570, partial [Cytophagaceae bacterium]